MNTNDLHPIPADFDDLSKHAPLLNELVRRTDFVVPEGYFETLPDQVLAVAQLPEIEGLVVPEGYFETVADTLEAQLALPEAVNVFPVAESYFTELPQQIDARLALPEAGEMPLPAAYFEAFEQQLATGLALDNLKQDEGHVVPDGYFAALTDKVLAHTSAELLQQGADADLPPGYFEQFPERLLAQTQPTTEVRGKVIALNASRWRITAAAAAVVLLIGVSTFWLLNKPETTGTAQALATLQPLRVQRPLVQPTLAPEQKTTPVLVAQQRRRPPSTSPTQATGLDTELLDATTVAEYAADVLNNQDLLPVDADSDLQYYLENVELGDLLPAGGAN